MAGFTGFEFQDIASDFGGPEYNFANDATRVIRPVQWKSSMQLDEFVKRYVGWAEVATFGGLPYIKRVIPHTFDGILYQQGHGSGPYLYCTAVLNMPSVQVHRNHIIRGVPFPGFQRAKILYETTTYRHYEDSDSQMIFQPAYQEPFGFQTNPYGATLPDEATLSRYITIYPQPFVRTITIPRAIPLWALEPDDKEYQAGVAGAPVWEGIGKPEPGITFEVVWHLVPEAGIPWSAIARTLGKVNRWRLPGKLSKFPTETLLLEACKLTPRVSPGGIYIYDVHYYMKWLPKFDLDGINATSGTQRGHNWFLRAVGSKSDSTLFKLAYRLLTLSGKKDSKADRVFQSIDFAYLFRPDLTV